MHSHGRVEILALDRGNLEVNLEKIECTITSGSQMRAVHTLFPSPSCLPVKISFGTSTGSYVSCVSCLDRMLFTRHSCSPRHILCHHDYRNV
jgi:hypothetical protein